MEIKNAEIKQHNSNIKTITQESSGKRINKSVLNSLEKGISDLKQIKLSELGKEFITSLLDISNNKIIN